MNKEILKIRKLEKEIDLLVNNKNIYINDTQELFLKKVIQILDMADKVYEGRESEALSDYKLKVLKRYESIFKGKKDIKDVNELLDSFLESLEKKLSKGSIKLDYDIYHSGKGINLGMGNGIFENQEKGVEKYKDFLNILMNKGINIDDIVVFEEELNKNRMRKFPYRIIYISEGKINKTILISDEIGQSTFIYDGIIDVVNFRKIEKGEEIEGLISRKIVYGSNYSSRLEENIFTEQIHEIDDNLKVKFSEKIINDDAKLKNIIEWQNFIYSKIKELEEESNIYKIDGKWYFGDAKGMDTWKYLINFPSGTFNKENNIGNNRGAINNPIELKKMFEVLGLNVAIDEEERGRWGKILEGYKEKLEEESNIYKIDGKWYFGDAKGMDTWKYLINFPSGKFNKENNIGDNRGAINNLGELKKMFEVLGLNVAMDEEERGRWGKILEGYKEKLEEESNIYKIDGKWYFGDAKGMNTWKYLINFPNNVFNRENNIGNNRGAINNPIELKKMFEVLGLNVAIDEEERSRWGKILEGYKEKLEEESNIYKIDGKWYFGDAKGMNTWKYLINFPRGKFNKENNIGNNRGAINNIGELKKMFRVLGLNIATEQE